MKKHIYVYAILIFLLLPFVFAQEITDPTEIQTFGGIEGFPPGEEIELIQVCSNCTYVNITKIVLGNNTILTINSAMTKDDTFYNYTLAAEYTTSFGEYVVSWKADNNGITDSGSYRFFVRKGGLLLTTGQSILYVVLILISLLSLIFFIYQSVSIPYTNERADRGTISSLIPGKYLKLLSIWFAYGSFLLCFGIISGIINNLLYLEITNNLFTSIYLYAYYISWGVTILILSVLFIEVWKDLFVQWIQLILRARGKRKKRI